jgi:hypothetical protein
MELFQMATTVDVPASFLSVLVFAYPASLSLVTALLLRSLPCPTEYSPLYTVETRISAALNRLSSVLRRVRVSLPYARIRHGSAKVLLNFNSWAFTRSLFILLPIALLAFLHFNFTELPPALWKLQQLQYIIFCSFT